MHSIPCQIKSETGNVKCINSNVIKVTGTFREILLFEMHTSKGFKQIANFIDRDVKKEILIILFSALSEDTLHRMQQDMSLAANTCQTSYRCNQS